MENKKIILTSFGFAEVVKETKDYIKIWLYDEAVTKYIQKKNYSFETDKNTNILICDY